LISVLISPASEFNTPGRKILFKSQTWVCAHTLRINLHIHNQPQKYKNFFEFFMLFLLLLII